MGGRGIPKKHSYAAAYDVVVEPSWERDRHTEPRNYCIGANIHAISPSYLHDIHHGAGSFLAHSSTVAKFLHMISVVLQAIVGSADNTFVYDH